MSISIPYDRPLSVEEIREGLIYALKQRPDNIQPGTLCNPESMGQAFGLERNDLIKFFEVNRGENFRKTTSGILNELWLNNIIVPKWEQSWGIFELTEEGVRVLSGEETMTLDPEGLIQKFNDLVPGGPDLSADYYRESVLAYRHRLFRCSTIAIGVASEAILRKAATAFHEYAVNPQRQQGEHKSKKLLDWKLSTVVEQLEQVLRSKNFLEGLIEDLKSNPLPFDERDKGVIDAATSSVGILANIYRQTRNEQGHPITVFVDQAMLRTEILAFPRYAETLFDISWIVKGKPPQFRAFHVEFHKLNNS